MMTELQKKILDIIQARFPIEAQPYAVVARQLNNSEEEIIAAVKQLKDGGIVRRIAAIFEAARLGYVSTLAAAQVPAEKLETFVADVNALSGVSHNYGRRHKYNVWFTLILPGMALIEQTLENLRQKHGIEAIYSLPAERLFKMRVDFDVTGRQMEEPNAKATCHRESRVVGLSDYQIALVRQLQEDLAVAARPFDMVAQATGLDVAAVLEQINQWKDNGTIRRFGASIRHQRIGFTYNGMVVFELEPERIEAAGKVLADYKEVSHCYQRPTAPGWPYNLFAMTHGKSEEQLREVVERMVEQIKPKRYDLLLSTAEYKKNNVKYFIG